MTYEEILEKVRKEVKNNKTYITLQYLNCALDEQKQLYCQIVNNNVTLTYYG